MRYFVTIGERVFEVDLTADGPVVDGRPVEARLATRPGTPVHHLVLDGRGCTVVARRHDGVWELDLGGAPIRADVVDERTRAIRAMTGGTGRTVAAGTVRAPMPGLVVRIEVEVGQDVTAGQGIVIMEAMKMENELRAEGSGRVARILVEPGQAVDKGTVLVQLEVSSDDA